MNLVSFRFTPLLGGSSVSLTVSGLIKTIALACFSKYKHPPNICFQFQVSLDYDWQWDRLRAPHSPPHPPQTASRTPQPPRASRTPRPPRTASGAPRPPRASPSLLLLLQERVEGRVRPNKLRLLQGFANSRIRPANPTQGG